MTVSRPRLARTPASAPLGSEAPGRLDAPDVGGRLSAETIRRLSATRATARSGAFQEGLLSFKHGKGMGKRFRRAIANAKGRSVPARNGRLKEFHETFWDAMF